MDPEPRASWLWKGAVRNAVSDSDPHCSASLPHSIILRIEVHTIKSRSSPTLGGFFLVLAISLACIFRGAHANGAGFLPSVQFLPAFGNRHEVDPGASEVQAMGCKCRVSKPASFLKLGL